MKTIMYHKCNNLAFAHERMWVIKKLV